MNAPIAFLFYFWYIQKMYTVFYRYRMRGHTCSSVAKFVKSNHSKQKRDVGSAIQLNAF